MRAVTLIGHGVTIAAAGLTGWVLWFMSTAEADTFVGEDVVVAAPEPEVMPEKPDVILITIDTLRADRLGIYGYEGGSTPTLDRLGRHGIVFTETTVPLPRTTPGLASLHTGLAPENHGSREVWQAVDDVTMLAEVFEKRGYQTVGLSSNSAAGTQQGFGRGFDEFVNRKEMKRRRKRDDADVVTRMAIEKVEKLDPDKPLFLWVHYVDPHWRYSPPKKKGAEDPTDAPKCRALQAKEKRHTLSTGQVTVDYKGLASAALADCSELYDKEITFNDREIGRLANRLSELGRWDDSIKVFTADHGENLGEDNYYYNHGPSLADASLVVPMIFAGPTIPAGKMDDGVTRIEDVVPTLMRIANVPAEDWPEVDGVDLSWRWTPGAVPPERTVNAAVAESGGALHLKAHSFIVSGRSGQRYCINDPVRYSMCFESPEEEEEAPAPSRRPSRANPPPPDPKPAAPSEADEHDDDPEAAASEKTPEPQFFDRDADPGLSKALAESDVPEEVRARLRKAAKSWGPETTRSRAVRTPEFKLVARPAMEGGFTYALYDLKRDPMERTDVQDKRPREFRQLMQILDRWESDLPIYKVRTRSAEEIEELKGLGYIGQ